jgi:tRNA/tmRNA/rRNA uracil-C5-methylase (TrmA/RlmC/RlmD family)
MIEPGARIILDVEKPAAGGRMLARHQGRVVLVGGAIPGERVSARIEREAKGVIYADTATVLSASPDRRDAPEDWRCGGNVFAHINYLRQLDLKAEIVQDAFVRIAHMPLPSAPYIMGSTEHGYRMRARLHAQDGKLGFFREGTHQLCDAAPTGQLAVSTQEWVAQAQQRLARDGMGGLAGIEIAENIPGTQRVCHLELHAGADPARFAALADGVTGLTFERTDRAGIAVLSGSPTIADVLHVIAADGIVPLTLQRDVRAFFQGNRFLIESLVRHVVALVPSGPAVDLYAGVGLFGLAVAAAGNPAVTLAEGDPISSADLQRNAQPFGDRVRIERRSVEAFLRSRGIPDGATFIVDPPRTGMSRDATASIIAKKPICIVYVSCDVATLARDTRVLLDGGYELEKLSGMDLFPNTAHVEMFATFRRAR